MTLAFALSRFSGWSLLARRFRADEPFYGESWSFQSARFRRWCNYNNCLTIGASQERLYIAVTPLLRLFSPFNAPLSIPWNEVEVEMGKMFFGRYDTATFRIGREERMSVRIYGKLVQRVRQAAGPAWPLYRQEESTAQPNW